jgi:alkanesulfonate monooxygenase SsuD/methylene tetrahydromethanopterin reductase-like flavin-dependent oxidoreductase (luciferase family)
MDAGMSPLFHNDGHPTSETDLARMADPLGFDTLWAFAHHFAGYSMVPETLQFLSYGGPHQRHSTWFDGAALG